MLIYCFLQSDTQVRIASFTNSGRVEIFYNGAWGTVCDDSFGDTEAGVICRMLGYSSGSAICCGGAGVGTGSIIVDNLACDGSETDILLCQHAGLLVHNCGHSEDAGITCS